MSPLKSPIFLFSPSKREEQGLKGAKDRLDSDVVISFREGDVLGKGESESVGTV